MNLIGSDTNLMLADSSSTRKFSTFFHVIKDGLSAVSTGGLCDAALKVDGRTSEGKLQVFRQTSASEVKKNILNSANNQCDLDSLPTWLLNVPL